MLIKICAELARLKSELFKFSLAKLVNGLFKHGCLRVKDTLVASANLSFGI